MRFVRFPPWFTQLRSESNPTALYTFPTWSSSRTDGERVLLSSKAKHRITGLCLVSVNFLVLQGCQSKSLTSLQVLPASGAATGAVGQTAQFQAIGMYTESNHASRTQDITDQVTWQSSNSAVATINATGLATGVSAGTASISASTQGSFGLVTGASNITVTAGASPRVLTSLTVIPSSQTLTTTGEDAQFIAIGAYSAAPLSQDLTRQVTWKTSAVSVAQVSATGLVTALGVGQATITAVANTSDGSAVSGSGSITVSSAITARSLISLTVTPGSETITSTGQTAQLIAIGTYNTAPLTQDLSHAVSWASSDIQVGTVNATGLVTGIGVGQTTITALNTAADGTVITANGSVTVIIGSSGRILTSLSLIPPSQTVTTAGETAQFIAIGTYSAAPLTVDLTDQVAWQSSDVKVGQVNSSGLATGIGSGSASITALATASDASVIATSATFAEASPAGPVNLPTLTVYRVGNGTGTVMGGTGISGGQITGTVVIDCGSGAGCIGTFPVGTKIYLVASTIPSNDSVFDGWSNNCTLTDANGNPSSTVPPATSPYCTVTTNNSENYTVGAIFDPTTP